MIAAPRIPVTKTTQSKLAQAPVENIPFGQYFTDHMLEADYEDGEWKNITIRPYQPLSLSPAAAALHYGQAIFEGIKAYKDEAGNVCIFRPQDNFNRFNASAARMEMPAVPEEIFMDGMRQLVDLDRDWIPAKPDHSLYLRPFMFASDDMIGVRPSPVYKFMIIMSLAGPYYSAPIRIYVEEKYTRAAPGGVGAAKAAGNYAAAMFPSAEARRKGYDQVLWTDAVEHKYVQEIGTMNVFFVLEGNKIWTPSLDGGTILAGVTRDSAVTLLKEMGYTVVEKPIHIEELITAYKSGQLKEVFGTGTAATVTLIKELCYGDEVMQFDVEKNSTAVDLKEKLNDIREGRVADPYGWLFKV